MGYKIQKGGFALATLLTHQRDLGSQGRLWTMVGNGYVSNKWDPWNGWFSLFSSIYTKIETVPTPDNTPKLGWRGMWYPEGKSPSPQEGQPPCKALAILSFDASTNPEPSRQAMKVATRGNHHLTPDTHARSQVSQKKKKTTTALTGTG